MRTLILVCMAALCLSCTTYESVSVPSNCVASDISVNIIQSNSTNLTIVGNGNATINYSETEDGFTVLKNQHGIYEYAFLENGELTSSGHLAKNLNERSSEDHDFLFTIEKHLKYSESQASEIRSDYNEETRIVNNHPINRFPSIGNRKVLVILIQYPDLAPTYSTENFQSLMMEEDYQGKGSFRDYFLKNSFNQLELDMDVLGWYTSEHEALYYGQDNGISRTRELMAEAIDAAEEAGVDFSQYDNDNDGVVDGIIGIHSGPGAEVGAQTEYIWSHSWTLGSSLEREYDGVTISNYIINPETRPWGMVGVGTICHEFGHTLGVPDLYDTDGSSAGLGNWTLMSKGSWLGLEQTPANFCAWAKSKLDWITPTVISEGYFSLNHADSHAECYRINTDNPEEYFLLENKQNIGNDTHLPGKGLAIWHINETLDTYPSSNNVNSDEHNKGVDLEEADGMEHLDNGPSNGDNGDLFPGSSLNTVFDFESTPSSVLSDGTDPNISITNIWEDGLIVRFALNYSVQCSSVEVEVNQFSCDLQETGTEVFNLHSVYGCDSVVTVNTDYTESYHVTLSKSSCNPDFVGVEEVYLTSFNGCDSIVTITTDLLPSYNIELDVITCVMSSQGVEVLNYSTHKGCDSTITITTTYLETSTSFEPLIYSNNVDFENYSSEAEEFYWEFGDGHFSNERSPNHSFENPGIYHVYLSAFREDCGYELVSQQIEISNDLAVGISDEAFATVNVYPNPTSEVLMVELGSVDLIDLQLNFYNSKGELVLINAAPTNLSSIELDVRSLSTGIYNLVLTDGKDLMTKQVMIQ